MSRGRGAPMAGLVQRTILPKNSEYIAFIPMMQGTQIPNPQCTEVTQTIVGHPINGIQTQPLQIVTTQSSMKSTAPVLPSPNVTFSSPTISCK